MPTVFPETGLDSFATLTDNVDQVLAADMNDRADAIVALETKVGVNNAAVATSLDYFLRNASGEFRTHKHDGSSDDGSAALGPITALTASSNLDIGAYDFRAQTLTADAIPSGYVVITTANGQLTYDTDISFAGSTLTVTNVDINGGNIDGTAIGAASPSTGKFTTLQASSAFTSTLATGTAPFTIASTTPVSNLNVDQVDSYHATSFLIAGIRHYGSSASSYTSRSQSGVYLCYGVYYLTAAATSVAITGLPFSSTATYSAVAIDDQAVDYASSIVINSASQFTITNNSAQNMYIKWFAIGT